MHTKSWQRLGGVLPLFYRGSAHRTAASCDRRLYMRRRAIPLFDVLLVLISLCNYEHGLHKFSVTCTYMYCRNEFYSEGMNRRVNRFSAVGVIFSLFFPFLINNCTVQGVIIQAL